MNLDLGQITSEALSVVATFGDRIMFLALAVTEVLRRMIDGQLPKWAKDVLYPLVCLAVITLFVHNVMAVLILWVGSQGIVWGAHRIADRAAVKSDLPTFVKTTVTSSASHAEPPDLRIVDSNLGPVAVPVNTLSRKE